MQALIKIIFINALLLLTMKDKTINKEQEDKLKKLKEKTSNPEVKASIDKKLKQGDKPFNK